MACSRYGSILRQLSLKNLDMKKVLVITYYWPPSGGGGVQRWLKFTKYLPEFGWEPIIFTPEIQNAPSYDRSLLKDIDPGLKVIRTPIWEPYSIYRKITNRKSNENLGASFASGKKSNVFVENLSNWIRSNFFIPDARKYWIKPSVKYLEKYIKVNNIEVVVTTGPPHSMHLIGLNLKKKTNIKWLADFRDPWTDIDYYDQLKLAKWANRKHHYLEKEVLQQADIVVSVSQSNKEQLGKKAKANIKVITNGFDDADFPKTTPTVDKRFTIAHIGTFMTNRNPTVLWEVLSEMVKDNIAFRDDFELQLVGKTDAQIFSELDRWKLTSYVKSSGPVSHEQAVQLQQKAQVVLITVNKTGDSKGMVTGKIFEYLVSGRPILAIGPEDGDLAYILKATETGVISNFNNKAGLKENINSYFSEYKSNMLKVTPKNLEKYSRKNLSGEMADLLNKLEK